MQKSMRWDHDTLYLLDQTALPHAERVLACRTAAEVAEAIRALQVRGAPAIGAAAAYGLVLGARQTRATDRQAFLRELARVAADLEATRPTAVNLRWALARMQQVPDRRPDASVAELREALLAEAEAIAGEDVRANHAIAKFGAALIRPEERILTYCNTGSLATVDYGTAFGIIRAAHDQGKRVRVIACETRPVLQGARLTAWEAQQAGIDVTLITDNAAGALMRRGLVDRVIVGADRVAANGDVANKIGTYTLAVLARAHEIPFIVAAPLSTVDLHTPDGTAIPIEERRPEEVTHLAGTRIAPEGVAVMNPAFDVTPHHLVTAIVTDVGVAAPPYTRSLRALAGAKVGG
ncbi:MAG: S-methyl-5-thioribose-1-phosphate isomerase [Armatimonadetes bacterium RBG_19FT_COMBO_69_19]|nr:MAG: S-methyl-5-thioribose-1-phosphate isomerase [Armatimonadetes bacterium RBG_19FT_COMBO_69_19]